MNCRYQVKENSKVTEGSSSKYKFLASTPTTLTMDNFSWHTEDGNAPFTPVVYELDNLKATFLESDCNAGTNEYFQELFLKSSY